MQQIELVVETRAHLRLVPGHSHAVFNVWRIISASRKRC